MINAYISDKIQRCLAKTKQNKTQPTWQWLLTRAVLSPTGCFRNLKKVLLVVTHLMDISWHFVGEEQRHWTACNAQNFPPQLRKR